MPIETQWDERLGQKPLWSGIFVLTSVLITDFQTFKKGVRGCGFMFLMHVHFGKCEFIYFYLILQRQISLYTFIWYIFVAVGKLQNFHVFCIAKLVACNVTTQGSWRLKGENEASTLSTSSDCCKNM